MRGSLAQGGDPQGPLEAKVVPLMDTPGKGSPRGSPCLGALVGNTGPVTPSESTQAKDPERRIFIGDIQGCREELERLLETLNIDTARDAVHPVGDLINRGPDSAGVLRILRELGAGGVLGNHDMHALRVRAGTRRSGKRDTLEDLFGAEDGAHLLDWLAARPFVRVWPDLVCVHAGIHPDWNDPLAVLQDLDPLTSHPHTDFATRVRTCDADGARPDEDWPPPGPPFRPWYSYWQEREEETRTVVYGHWASAGLVRKPRVRGLDTGCVWGKRLTAWIAEEDRCVHVDAARVYSASSLPPSDEAN